MKAHRVKCQQCSHGVTVVGATPKDGIGLIGDENGQILEVFAGQLDEDTAVAKMAEIVAEQENEARKAITEEGAEPYEELTANDIRQGWNFDVQSMPIRP